MKSLFTLLLISCSLSLFAKPEIAIIIDDLGNDFSYAEQTALLPGPVTCSILPFRSDTVVSAQLAHDADKEVIVHVPMQADNGFPMGKGGLSVTMSSQQLQQQLLKDLNDVPFRIGFNNHMGSRLTQDQAAMTTVMRSAKPLHLFFIDSRTTAKTVAEKTAIDFHVPTLSREVFLDDQHNMAYINHQFHRLLAIAKKNGYAIAIGHPFSSTLDYLQFAIQDLKKTGVKLVPLSTLIKQHGLSTQKNH